MRLRTLLVALILAATAAFVVGVVLERSSGERHSPAVEATEQHGEGGGGEAAEGGEHRESGSAHESGGEELRPLGIDVEAAPFVALAAAISVALALAAWLRPSRALLLLIALAMLAFAVLDAREIAHQLDEDRTGLAVLAGFVTVLHAGAAAVAVLLARSAQARQS